MSVRENERVSARGRATGAGRVAGPRCWAERGRGRAQARGCVAGPLGWAGPEGERESARVRFCFSFSKF
jgi:hypothetical protein